MSVVNTDDGPRYRDPERLRAAYERHDTIAEVAEEFDASYRAVRTWLVRHEIHEPTEKRHLAAEVEALDPADVPALGGEE